MPVTAAQNMGTARCEEVQIESEELATAMAAVVLEYKATEVAILDMRELVSYTDVFVICTASNRRQVQAIADAVASAAKRDHDISPTGIEGMEAARWVLVDLGDIVVHVFDGPLREFYDLDGLWRDAPRLAVPDVEGADDDEPEDKPLFTLP